MHVKWAIIVALFAAGCGQAFEAARAGAEAGSDGQARDAEPSDGGMDSEATTSDGASGDAVVDASGDAISDVRSDVATDAGSWSPACPAIEPTVGESCAGSATGLQCEYGILRYLYKVEYDISCDVIRECTGGKWADELLSTTACQPDGVNSVSCPPKLVATTEGSSCPAADKGIQCEYPDGVCVCSAPLGGPVMLGDAGPAATWGCLPGANCPMPRPRLGSACSPTVQTTPCTYQACAFEESCGTNGLWQGMETACAEPLASP